jgi:hypothetical protein
LGQGTLCRVAENTCSDFWPNVRRELQKIKLASFGGPASSFSQRTEFTAAQRVILAGLGLSEPPTYSITVEVQ